jgi:hypothetical protein
MERKRVGGPAKFVKATIPHVVHQADTDLEWEKIGVHNKPNFHRYLLTIAVAESLDKALYGSSDWRRLGGSNGPAEADRIHPGTTNRGD